MDKTQNLDTTTANADRGGLGINPSDLSTLKDYLSRTKEAYSGREFPGCIAHATRALELDPKNMDALLARGMAYMSLHQSGRAHKDLSDLVELDPKNILAYSCLANVFVQLTDYSQARTCMEKAKDIKPDDSLLHFGAGTLCLLDGDMKAMRDNYFRGMILLLKEKFRAIRTNI